MFGILRQFARALTGKVDALEFALGILFGVFLGLIPLHEIDVSTGFLGLNALWLWILLVCLVLKASLPITLLFAGFTKLLAIAFLDQVAFRVGQGLLDNTLPESMVIGFANNMPSLQLHTHWGFGTFIFAVLIGVPTFLMTYFTMRSKLPVWREKFGQTKLAKALGGFFLFRLLGRLLA
ncbi:MAG: hypothetical protein O3A95_01985 [Planctomycetota bacterium]|nr:hypothetical protein [Planctomycetota bacterium]MDA1113053.1 hypothetical protein [Planctomycetota bacterium]